MKGVPWNSKVHEIEHFFSDTAYVRDSILIGENNDGRTTGQVALLFENPKEAYSAMLERAGKNIGS